jgi:ribosomal protein S27E
MTKAFCVKEKKTREVSNPKQVTFKNGTHAIRGKCSSCGTTLFRITGK